MAIKGVGITVTYWAWNTSTNTAVTGDSANHAIRTTKDGTDAAATNAPAEISSANQPGKYKIALTNAEMTASVISPAGKSSTSNVVLIFGGDIITEQGILPSGTTAGANGGLPVQGGAIPNAAANAAGGLPVSIAGALDMDDLAADVDNIETQIGIAGAGLSGIPKTGFKLASDGLDSVSTTEPTGVASTFRDMVVQGWCRWFRPSSLTTSQLKTFASDGSTLRTTQAVSDNGTTQTQGNAT